jgi:hypothetical protein
LGNNGGLGPVEPGTAGQWFDRLTMSVFFTSQEFFCRPGSGFITDSGFVNSEITASGTRERPVNDYD